MINHAHDILPLMIRSMHQLVEINSFLLLLQSEEVLQEQELVSILCHRVRSIIESTPASIEFVRKGRGRHLFIKVLTRYEAVEEIVVNVIHILYHECAMK
jgi:hypothetical protein